VHARKKMCVSMREKASEVKQCVRCGVLQCWEDVAVCFNVLQCAAVQKLSSVCVAVCCSVLRTLQRVSLCCSVLQGVAVCCSVLQCVRCGVLQCFKYVSLCALRCIAVF